MRVHEPVLFVDRDLFFAGLVDDDRLGLFNGLLDRFGVRWVGLFLRFGDH